MLVNLLAEDRTISFLGCTVQFFLVCTFVVTELILFAVMAYDRFMPICNLLLYTVVMSQRLCAMLAVMSYAWGVACSLTLTCSAVKFSFRGFNTINHFFCELSSLISLSYSDSYLSTLLLFTVPPLIRWSHCSSFSLLTCSLLSPPWRCSQLVGTAKPSPPAPPAWPPSASSMAPSTSSTVCPTPQPPGTWSKWPLCFTCWIPWPTVWEIRMSRTQWAN